MPTNQFQLNGAAMTVDADPDQTLLDVLRGRLGVTGPHFGCGAGECGACYVMVGDRAMASCDMPMWSVADKDVVTVGKASARPSSRIRCNAPSSPSRRCNAAIASRGS
ncbi:aerobic-type carbon monoxide dehydrogenase small subunit (CoxS/CutS family) [Bradyrhizobium sp. i1.4.4]